MSMLEEYFDNKTIEVSQEEAALIDWVLTLHVFNQDQLEWLMKEDAQRWREQACAVIGRSSKTIKLSDNDLKILLVLIPITFRFSQIDVGYSLKQKMIKAYLNIEEVKDDNQNKTKDNPKTRDSAEP